jgi:DNA-binding LacI/PurR family transcriptional regulator
MSKKPTIKDVAARAGVSNSLVSLVMRGAPNVSDARREAVLEAARELGYRPNRAARALAEQRSRVVGVFVSDFHNPFFNEMVEGLNAAAIEAGYHPIMNTGSLDTDREVEAIETLIELQVDGLILMAPRTKRSYIEEVASRIPTVATGFSSRSELFDSIAGDERIGSAVVVDHLVKLGHRDIAHVHGRSAPGARPRRLQYERSMRRHGLEDHIRAVPGDFTEQGGIDGITEILDEGTEPTAVFMGNDFAALGALEVLDERRIRVPRDLSIVGYDNLDAAKAHRVELTTVDQPRFAMGELSMQLLLERLDRQRTTPKHVVLPPRLVVRTTTGPPRG